MDTVLPAMGVEPRRFAGLPLHDPTVGWLPATYRDGMERPIDLRTLFLEADAIAEVGLSLPYATAMLHHVLLSISEALLWEMEGFRDARDSGEWDRARRVTILANGGFPREVVESYFDRYQDRFFLVHSHFPFMQFPPVSPWADGGRESLTTREFLGRTGPISQGDPRALTPGSGNKVVWGLPEDDFLSVETPREVAMARLMEVLLYQSFGYGPVPKARHNWPDGTAAPTHPVQAALRSTTSYLVQGDSLFQTLLIASTFNPHHGDPVDMPLWEWEVNGLGYLGLQGLKHNYYDRFVEGGHRSAVNASQMGVVFVPETVAGDGSISGRVRMVRAVAAILTKTETETMPRLTWAPYAAVKTDTGRSAKQSTPISSQTMLSLPTLYGPLFAVAQVGQGSSTSPPEVVAQFLSLDLDEEPLLGAFDLEEPLSVRILIQSESLTQDALVAGVLESRFPRMNLAHLVNDREVRSRLASWTSLAGNLHHHLQAAAARAAVGEDPSGGTKPRDSASSLAYWAGIQNLFQSAVHLDGLDSIVAHRDAILDLVRSVFNEMAGPYVSQSPVAVSSNRLNLLSLARRRLS